METAAAMGTETLSGRMMDEAKFERVDDGTNCA
jgi:hypothetical protein